MLADYKKYLKFKGIHPLTGVRVYFVFNEPAPGRANILDWDGKQWWYSENAGLRWRIIPNSIAIFYMEGGFVDMVMDKGSGQ